MKIKVLRRILIIFGLCAIDQLIKIVIDRCFMNVRFEIRHIIGFRPVLNTEQLSIFNNELGLGLELWVLNIINVVGLIFLIALYVYLKRKYNDKKLVEPAMLFMIAGGTESLIDKLFWGGSLDYILFARQISDLKDIYLLAGAAVFMVFLVRQSIEDSKKKKMDNNTNL